MVIKENTYNNSKKKLFSSRTTEEWEHYLGEQIRTIRIRNDLEQIELAKRADISLGALRNLENGNGSALKTIIKTLMALNKTDWLETLAPQITVSPIQMLQYQQKQKSRERVFRHRQTRKTRTQKKSNV